MLSLSTQFGRSQSDNVANYGRRTSYSVSFKLLVTSSGACWGMGGIKTSTVLQLITQKRSKNLLSDFFSSCLTIVHTPAPNKPLSEAGPRPLLSPCTRLQCKRLRLLVRFHRRHARAEARVLPHRQACLLHKSPPSRSTGTGVPLSSTSPKNTQK